MDEMGHVNNAVYLRWVQETIVAQEEHSARRSYRRVPLGGAQFVTRRYTRAGVVGSIPFKVMDTAQRSMQLEIRHRLASGFIEFVINIEASEWQVKCQNPRGDLTNCRVSD
ncbi:MAG: hypothetical protein ACK4QP_03575 [Pseudorhizobium sp.]